MTDARRRRQRRLSEAERTLWSEVTQGVRPLRPSSRKPHDVAQAEPEPRPKPAETAAKQRGRAAPPTPGPAPPPLAPLGRRMRQRIARGAHAIGDRLDLHGLTQREAHDALLRFLCSARERDITLVLVITGKGAPTGGRETERGVLKRHVPQWLRLPAFRELIVGFEHAHVSHGGEGALYVRLRRRRHSF